MKKRVVDDAKAEQNSQKEIAEVLKRMGVEDSAAEDAAALAGLTPLGVALLRLEADKPRRKKIENPAGWLLSRLEAGATGPELPWGPEEVCEVIRRRWITELDGQRFDAPGITPGFNDEGLCIRQNGQEKPIRTIPLKKLWELAGRPVHYPKMHEKTSGGEPRRAKRQAKERRQEDAARQAAEAEAQEQQQAAKEAAWAACTPERQADFTAEAERHCRLIGGPQREAVVESTAHFLAWQSETKR